MQILLLFALTLNHVISFLTKTNRCQQSQGRVDGGRTYFGKRGEGMWRVVWFLGFRHKLEKIRYWDDITWSKTWLAIRRSNSHEQERTRHGRSTLLTAPRAVRRFFVRHRLLACFSRPEKSGPRCFEQQHKSNKAMEATKSHVQARKHKCDDQLIIECWFHKFRIEGSWNQPNYEFEMLVWRCTNLPTAEAKPEYVNAKAVQATGFKGMPKVLSSTKPNPKSSLANTFIACQYSLADCRGQGHITATGLAADGMQIQMIKQQITRQVMA